MDEMRRNMDIPPGFEADISRAQQLQSQLRRNPRALNSLVKLYERMLKRLKPNDSPLFYANIQSKLGNAYYFLQTGNRVANLKQAITCYQEALRFWRPETHPLEYAAIQHWLGITYSELPTGDRTDNLEQAIACYQEALCFQTPEIDSHKYAELQHRLGIT